MTPLEEILSKLVAFPSVTPKDAGCQEYFITLLESLGFHCTRYNNPPVANFFAQIGHEKPLFVFAGHTDVVSTGDETQWQSPPFKLTNINGTLYGRGVADMKGSLAAMVIAAQKLLMTHPKLKGSIGFLITSGEEGDHFHLGTEYVMKQLQEANLLPDYCIVGEPSSHQHVGDMIKIGRRGSLSGHLTLKGKQGHVAYPHLAINPIHTLAPALNELVSIEWDKGNAHFPPTSFQLTQMHSGGHGGNVIPGEIVCDFNIRFSTEQTEERLKQRVMQCFSQHHLHPEINWRLNGLPFLTARGKLLESTLEVIQRKTNALPQCSTSGGTSDGRFIAPYGIEVIELGPCNASIHQTNENVTLEQLENLADIYYEICLALLG